MKVYATCDIVITPTAAVKPLRKRSAEIDVEIFSSQGAGEMKPITVTLKGAGIQHVFDLMTVYHKTDEELAEKVRGSALSGMVEGMSTEEAAAWARGNILEEFAGMQGGGNEDSLVQG